MPPACICICVYSLLVLANAITLLCPCTLYRWDNKPNGRLLGGGLEEGSSSRTRIYVLSCSPYFSNPLPFIAQTELGARAAAVLAVRAFVLIARRGQRLLPSLTRIELTRAA